MIVALAFEKNTTYWHQLFHTERCNYAWSDLEFVACADGSALRQANPHIIVGQQSQMVLDYISPAPDGLQWLHIMAAGINELVDALRGRNVTFAISNNRGDHGPAMAEYVLACLLYFEKDIARWVSLKAEKVWQPSVLSTFANKRALIVGAGAIGSKLAKSLGTLAIAVDGIATSDSPRQFFSKLYKLDSLSEITPNYDFIISCLPLTVQTRGIFSKSVFGVMKTGSIFINVSRGELVDEQALISALRDNVLKGAALDAFSVEPLPPDSPLWEQERLLLTPHVAGRWQGGHQAGVRLFADNLASFRRDGKPITQVFLDRGY